MSNTMNRIVRAIAVALLAAGIIGMSSWAWDNVIANWFVASQEEAKADNVKAGWSAPNTEQAVPVLDTYPQPREVFALLRIPAFGNDYVRRIGETTSKVNVLDKIGVGHYAGTALPGEVGNFAVAAHRTTHGAAFMDLDKLKQGDRVYVETKDGIYTYTVQYSKEVKPSDTTVIAEVPRKPGETATERWMTMTTCTPKYTAWRRLAVFAKFTSFQPATTIGK